MMGKARLCSVPPFSKIKNSVKFDRYPRIMKSGRLSDWTKCTERRLYTAATTREARNAPSCHAVAVAAVCVVFDCV